MKVLFISSRADIGGGPKHLLDLLSSKSLSEVEKYAALPFGYELSEKIISQTSKSIPIPHRKFSFISIIRLLIFCRENGIQLIHSHGRGAGLYSRLLSLFGFKVVHTFHGIHHEKTFIGAIKLFIDKFLSPLTDNYICVSADEKKLALQSNVCRDAHVIYNGVSFIDPNPYQIKNHFKAGVLARLSYQKGIDILIKNLSNQQNLDFVVEVAGSGEEEEKLLKNSKNLQHLKFIGQLSEPQAFLRSCDLFVSSSRWEGFPLSVLEAMACGLPCLLPDVIGHAFFKEQDTALFYDLNSSRDFLNKIMTLKNDPQLRLRLSQNGHSLIKSTLNIENMGKETTLVYQSLFP